MMIFIRIRSVHNSHLLYLMMSLSYAIIVICIKIIYYSYDTGTYMDEDCWLDTWMIIQSYIVRGMMMMSSHLYDDRLFHILIDADIPN